MSARTEINPEYVYITIPKEYVCVYHKIMVMLADYGEDMLKDCKASCKDRNSNVIDCFNMFNAAVAARKLGKTKLAETLIKYVEAKVCQIYNGTQGEIEFTFPIDENGMIKSYITCGETVKFEIDAEDGELYAHKFGDGFNQHFELSESDLETTGSPHGLYVEFTPYYHKHTDDKVVACCNLFVSYNGEEINYNDAAISYTFDGEPVVKFEDVTDIEVGEHTFVVAVVYNGETEVKEETLYYELS